MGGPLWGRGSLRIRRRTEEEAFSTLVAGHGNDAELAQEGIPAQPVGRLNTDNALFMTHPINGLDDLLYIVLFGARPYARGDVGEPQPATSEQIFREFGVEQLACRHADPAAAMGAHGAAFNGRTVAFADPWGCTYRPSPRTSSWYRITPCPRRGYAGEGGGRRASTNASSSAPTTILRSWTTSLWPWARARNHSGAGFNSSSSSRWAPG